MNGKRFDALTAAVSFAAALVGLGVPMIFAPELTDVSPFLRALFTGLCFFAPAALGFAAVRLLNALRGSPRILFPAGLSRVAAAALAAAFVLGFAGQYLYMLRFDGTAAGTDTVTKIIKVPETDVTRETVTDVVKEETGSDIVLMIETSGSMAIMFSPIKDACENFADMLTDVSNLEIAEFFDSAQNSTLMSMRAMDSAGNAAAHAAISPLTALHGDDGKVDAALETACTVLGKSEAGRKKIVIVIGDEGTYQDYVPSADARKAVQDCGAIVYLIAPDDYAALKFMTDETEAFARQTGGEAFRALLDLTKRTPDDMDAILSNLDQAFRQIADAAADTVERTVEYETERVIEREKEKTVEEKAGTQTSSGPYLENGLVVYDDNGPGGWTMAVRILSIALLSLFVQAAFFGTGAKAAFGVSAALSLPASLILAFAHALPSVWIAAAVTALAVFTCYLMLTPEPPKQAPIFDDPPTDGYGT